MSYCRINVDSDVYMFHHVAGYISCCFCSMKSQFDQSDPEFINRTDAAQHLRAHRVMGDKVPEYAFKKLFKELHEEGDLINGTNSVK